MKALRTLARRGALSSLVALLFAISIGAGHGFQLGHHDLGYTAFDPAAICYGSGDAPDRTQPDNQQRDARTDCCLTGCTGPDLLGRNAELVWHVLQLRPAPDGAAFANAPVLRGFPVDRTQQPRAPPV